MKQILVSKSAKSSAAQELMAELEKTQDRPGKVYSTFVGNYCLPKSNNFPAMCELATTSKEVHLRLGQFSLGAQEQLTLLLFQELKEGSGGLLLSFNEGQAIFVTLDRSGDAYVVFHLSLAN